MPGSNTAPNAEEIAASACAEKDAAISAAELVRYREAVETLFAIQSDRAISNGMPAHASILFESFFKHAKDHVRIFCEKLRAEVFDNECLVREAKWALARNVRVTVMTQQAPEPSPFLDLLNENNCENRCLLRATGDMATYKTNFTVMDSEAVRIEPDNGDVKAIAIMHAPEYASQWVRFFDRNAMAIIKQVK